MLLLESLILLDKWKLPNYVFPYYTPHEMLSLLHKVYPAFINCCRCLITAFHVDYRAKRIEELQEVLAAVDSTTKKFRDISQVILQLATKSAAVISSSESLPIESAGIMSLALQNVQGATTILYDTANEKSIKRESWIVRVAKSQSGGIVINLALYLIVRYLLTKFKTPAK